MKNLLLFFLALSITHYSFSQQSVYYPSNLQNAQGQINPTGKFADVVDFSGNTNAESLDDLVSENNKFGRIVTVGNNKYQITNTLYLFDTNDGFTNVYTVDGKGYKVPNANFNLNSQQLEIPLDNNQVFVFDLSNVIFFEKNNRKYARVAADNHEALYEVLIENENGSLLKGFQIVTKDAMTNPLTNEITKPAYNIKVDKFFLQFDDQLFELEQSNRNFLKTLTSNHQEEVKKFLKTNDINLNEEEDMKAVVEYYFSLVN